MLDLNETVGGMLKMLQRLIGEDPCFLPGEYVLLAVGDNGFSNVSSEPGQPRYGRRLGEQ